MLLQSPLGRLFSLPVRQSSLSGQLLHQLLCRQLHTPNSEETWFVFGGYPIRFSLTEFHNVTGLCCAHFPSEDRIRSATTHPEGSYPYWYELVGGPLGKVTIETLLERVKKDPSMPSWKKFQLSLVVIVDGILLCNTHPVKPSLEVVEMVRHVDFFLNYPWGRHAFTRTLNLIKVGHHIHNITGLVHKLKQSSMSVHGFPLAIQLHAFNCVPSFLKYLPHSDELFTFRDRFLPTLPKLKSFHSSNILQVEYDPTVSPPPSTCFLPTVTHLTCIIAF